MVVYDMETDLKRRRWPWGDIRAIYSISSVHSAAEWAAEQRETADYVSILGHSLENGGTIAESTMGENPISMDDAQQGTPRNEHLRRVHNEKVRQKRQQEQHQKHAELARYPAWERNMLSSRGHWTQHKQIIASNKNLLLIRQGTNLYIRVRDRTVDAGIYQGNKFESFWAKRFPSFDNAMSFVLRRAMGTNQEHKKA